MVEISEENVQVEEEIKPKAKKPESGLKNEVKNLTLELADTQARVEDIIDMLHAMKSALGLPDSVLPKKL